MIWRRDALWSNPMQLTFERYPLPMTLEILPGSYYLEAGRFTGYLYPEPRKNGEERFWIERDKDKVSDPVWRGRFCYWRFVADIRKTTDAAHSESLASGPMDESEE